MQKATKKKILRKAVFKIPKPNGKVKDYLISLNYKRKENI